MTKEQLYSTEMDTLLVTPFPSFILLPNGTIAKGNLEHFDYSTEDIERLKEISIEDTLFAAVDNAMIESIVSSTVPLRLQEITITTKHQAITSVTLYTKPITVNEQEATYVLCVPTDEMRSIDADQQHLSDLKNGIHQSFMTVTLDQDGFIIQTNQAFLKTSHWTPKRVIGKTFWQLFPSTEASEKVTQDIWKTVHGGQIWQGDVQKITKDEQLYWVHLTAIPLFGPTPEQNQYLLIERDITKDKSIQFQLEKIAYIDPETGMINVHRLAQIITEMIEEKRHFSFVYLSIDKFYTIKDLHHDLD
ncbi:MAG TPA: PAS domain-containing protein, partial [Solibacillus sp.]